MLSMSDPNFELPLTKNTIETAMAEGLHIGAQLHVSLGSLNAIDWSTGFSRPGVPMTRDTLMIWLSSGKPVTAVCVGQLWERGKLQLTDRVSQYIPEFAQGGKEAITIRQLLVHTGGFRAGASNWMREDWNITIARICKGAIEPGWVPGKKAGYHVAASWFILGELVRRIDGRPFEQYVREEIFLPLNMPDCWIGIPIEQYRGYGDRIGIMQNTEGANPKPHTWDALETATLCKPGANARGPAHQFVRFYQMLLNGGELDGTRILNSPTVDAMTARQRIGMFDHTFKHKMDWGYGFVVNNAMYDDPPGIVRYGYGPYASLRSFGHSGHQSSVAFADPENNLAAVIIFNGTPGELVHDRRIRATLKALYEDLDLVGQPL